MDVSKETYRTFTVSITLSIEAETEEEAKVKFFDYIADGIYDHDSIEIELED